MGDVRVLPGDRAQLILITEKQNEVGQGVTEPLPGEEGLPVSETQGRGKWYLVDESQ